MESRDTNSKKKLGKDAQQQHAHHTEGAVETAQWTGPIALMHRTGRENNHSINQKTKDDGLTAKTHNNGTRN